jgi:hypothetical protein
MSAGGPVSWGSRKARSVAVSSTEAEYLALGWAIRDAIWLRRLLANLRQEEEEGQPEVLLYEDNKSALTLARTGNTSRAKHIDIQAHFIKDEIDQGCHRSAILLDCRDVGGRADETIIEATIVGTPREAVNEPVKHQKRSELTN